MRRVRWLGAQWPISMRTLASRMKAQLFTQDSFDGFVIDRVRDDSIEAHYIEKLSYQETVTDPFGEEIAFERVKYRQIDFTLYADFPNIELYDAHRSSREFISKLLELCNFSLTIEPFSVDLLTWIERFEVILGVRMTVDSLQVSGVELESGIQAKMLLKGNGDVRSALDRISSKRKFELEKLQVKILSENQVIPVHLSSSATAKIPEDHWEYVLHALRNSLAAQGSKR